MMLRIVPFRAFALLLAAVATGSGRASAQVPDGAAQLPDRPEADAVPPKVRVPKGLLATAASGGIVHLEFDRMTGTAFPTAQERGGKRHDLRSIYLDGAGVVLMVNEDETGIAPLVGPRLDPLEPPREYISPAELDNLARAHRASPVASRTVACVPSATDDSAVPAEPADPAAPAEPAESADGVATCTQYFVYGLVVDHWLEDAFGPSEGTLGIMWDTTNRSQFAMFYRNDVVSQDAGKYLRSTAHEIGHAFNLHHEDGDGRSTIMNQTWVVGDNYAYEFSATERAHLRDHAPRSCSRPGGGSFYSVEVAHAIHGRRYTAGCK
jgi:hypothetical protein